MVDKSELNEFLKNLNLSPEEIKIFQVLSSFGSLPILQIAKKTNIPRTTLYRMMESMKKKGLVEEVVDEHRVKYKTTGLTNLEMMVKTKEEETQKLKSLLPSVSNLLMGIVETKQPETEVKFYKGQEGIRQMVWNTLKADKYVQGYTYRTILEIVGEEFADNWKVEFYARGLSGRDIYSDEYLKSVNRTKPILTPTDTGWESRYFPDTQLLVDHQIDIYDNVVSFYNWYKGDIFGVEIYNEKVARLQKQIFEILWGLGKKEKSE